MAGRYLVAALGLAVPLAVLGTVLAAPVTTAVFGDRWEPAVPTVRVLAVILPVILAGHLLWFTLLAEGQEGWTCVGALAGAGTSVAATAALLAVSPNAAAGGWGTSAGAVVLVLVLTVRFVLTRRARRNGPGDDHPGDGRAGGTAPGRLGPGTRPDPYTPSMVTDPPLGVRATRG